MSVLSERRAIGVGLALTGVPLGMYSNYLFPAIGWSSVFMLSSVLLITSYSALAQGRLVAVGRVFALLSAYQLMMIFYGLLSEELTFQLLSFHLFALGLILSLCSKKLTEGELDDSIFWAFIFSGLCTLLGAYYLWNGLMVGEEAWQLRKDNENYALEIFTAASAAVTNFTFLYFPKDRPRIFQLARYPDPRSDISILRFQNPASKPSKDMR